MHNKPPIRPSKIVQLTFRLYIILHCVFVISKMLPINLCVFVCFVIIMFLQAFNGFPTGEPKQQIPPTERKQHHSDQWAPSDGRDAKEWIGCHGLSCDEWKHVQRTLQQLNHLQKSSLAATVTAGDNAGAVTSSSPVTAAVDNVRQSTAASVQPPIADFVVDGTFSSNHDRPAEFDAAKSNSQSTIVQLEGPDILLTAEQADAMLAEAKRLEAEKQGGSHMTNSRARRQTMNNFVQLWDLPIVYKFNGQHDEAEKAMIRQALEQWKINTCVTFQEVSANTNVVKSHLLFTKASSGGCSSFIGRQSLPAGNPQMINLASECLSQPSQLGVPVHEIGHALGLWHEHQRSIRDQYVDVMYGNIADWAIANFQLAPPQSDDQKPYDVNSVMHYSGQVGANKDNANTIQTKDPLLQRNIGQRKAMSFFDIKAINTKYCKNKCAGTTQLKCQNGGYQDPNDCTKCRCPDGLAGTVCDQTATSNNLLCGNNLIEMGMNDVTSITSPGFSDGRQYDIGLECNYLIKVPAGSQVLLEVKDDFSIYSPLVTCMNWVEVRYKADLSMPGPRMCGNKPSATTFTSESNQAVVMFRTPYTSAGDVNRRGFKLQIRTVWSDANQGTAPSAQPTSSGVGNQVNQTPAQSSHLFPTDMLRSVLAQFKRRTNSQSQ